MRAFQDRVAAEDGNILCPLDIRPSHDASMFANVDDEDWMNLQGENLAPSPLPDGFTPRGIVALTFSIISALLGVGVVGRYGSAPITAQDAANVATKVGELK